MTEETKVGDPKQMRYALLDIEKYASQLGDAAKLLNELAQTLLDVPGADSEAKASEGFAQIYATVAEELKRLTSRGLERE